MRNLLKRHIATALGLLTALACAAGPARADIIYTQPSDFPVSGRVGVYASQNDTAVGGFGNFATAYDNFRLSSAASITGVNWQGGYFGPPIQGPITAFTLTFWSDNSGQPGTPLLSEKIPSNANETFVGTEPSTGAGGQDLVFNYSTNLPTAFDALANTNYWLSIVPDLVFDQNPNPAFGQWGWHTGIGGDGTSMQDFFNFGTGGFDRFTNPNDLAFTLTGTVTPAAVPEPASLAVWGLLGLGALGYYRLRRRQGAR
jgi:MYXO-CTERM domain-containing protein